MGPYCGNGVYAKLMGPGVSESMSTKLIEGTMALV